MKNVLDRPTYLAADVCRAAGIEEATLHNWVNRPNPPIALGRHDRRADIQGRPHLFTLRRVLQIAIVAELVRLRFPPRVAAEAAHAFSDEADGYAGFGPVGGEFSRKHWKRPSGHLYEGQGVITLLVIIGDEAHVVPVDYDTPISQVLLTAPGVMAATIVDLTSVVSRVETAVGNQP